MRKVAKINHYVILQNYDEEQFSVAVNVDSKGI